MFPSSLQILLLSCVNQAPNRLGSPRRREMSTWAIIPGKDGMPLKTNLPDATLGHSPQGEC